MDFWHDFQKKEERNSKMLLELNPWPFHGSKRLNSTTTKIPTHWRHTVTVDSFSFSTVCHCWQWKIRNGGKPESTRIHTSNLISNKSQLNWSTEKMRENMWNYWLFFHLHGESSKLLKNNKKNLRWKRKMRARSDFFGILFH